MAARFKEFLKKYGKVGLAVHCSVSVVSISGLYVAIKNNVDVESMLEKVGMPSLAKDKNTESSNLASEHVETAIGSDSGFSNEHDQSVKERNRTTELAATKGGAFALALLINKALFPVRVPITLALTRPVARFLAKRNLIKTDV